MEIVIVGGTFLFMPKDYQENFIKSCYDALNGTDSKNLQEAKSNNEHAKIRNVGFTIETKPDYCKKEHVDGWWRGDLSHSHQFFLSVVLVQRGGFLRFSGYLPF